MKLLDRLQTIDHLLGDDQIRELGLLSITDNNLVSPIADDMLSLFSYRTSRPDEFRKREVVEGLIERIKANEKFKGINHVGFCYKVASKEAEVKRLIGLASSKGILIYQEPSIDDGDWLFIGDITDITSPLLELIPHEGNTNDKWMNYWLPHIQIDINTELSPEEIKTIVKEYISDDGVPYSIRIDGVTYIQRVRLGCVEGINIFLDIATNNRNLGYRHQWKRLG